MAAARGRSQFRVEARQEVDRTGNVGGEVLRGSQGERRRTSTPRRKTHQELHRKSRVGDQIGARSGERAASKFVSEVQEALRERVPTLGSSPPSRDQPKPCKRASAPKLREPTTPRSLAHIMSSVVTGLPVMSLCLRTNWVSLDRGREQKSDALKLVELGQVVDVASKRHPVVGRPRVEPDLLRVPGLVVVGADELAEDDDVCEGAKSAWKGKHAQRDSQKMTTPQKRPMSMQRATCGTKTVSTDPSKQQQAASAPSPSKPFERQDASSFRGT